MYDLKKLSRIDVPIVLAKKYSSLNTSKDLNDNCLFMSFSVIIGLILRYCFYFC